MITRRSMEGSVRVKRNRNNGVGIRVFCYFTIGRCLDPVHTMEIISEMNLRLKELSSNTRDKFIPLKSMSCKIRRIVVASVWVILRSTINGLKQRIQLFRKNFPKKVPVC